MKNNRSLEIGTGLFVLLGFAALAFLTTQLPGTSLRLSAGDSGYRVTARFDNIGGLKVRAHYEAARHGRPGEETINVSANAQFKVALKPKS